MRLYLYRDIPKHQRATVEMNRGYKILAWRGCAGAVQQEDGQWRRCAGTGLKKFGLCKTHAARAGLLVGHPSVHALDELGVSQRTVNLIRRRRREIETVSAFRALTYNDVLEWRNGGVLTAQEVMHARDTWSTAHIRDLLSLRADTETPGAAWCNWVGECVPGYEGTA